MKITGVLLAAGSSSRMGSTNKLLLRYNNHSILDEVLIQLLSSKLEELVIVTGHDRNRIDKIIEPYLDKNITVLFNSKYQQGRATSIHLAVNNIDDKSEALLFMVADKPTIQNSLINKTIDEFKKMRSDILYVQTPSGRGHPIIFSRKLFGELLELEGDIIGNEIIEKHIDNTIVIEDKTMQKDIDTYDDYLSLING